MPTTPVHNADSVRKPATTTTEARKESSSHSITGTGKQQSRHNSPAPPTSTSTHNTTMSTASSAAAPSEMTYYLLPNLQALDPSACEMDATTHAWVEPTVIEDDDLTFGGKSLSAWYEEDRRRLSHSDGEETRRGRERVRRSHSNKSGRK